jgi:two-component system OmpR family sensor kinase
VKSEAPVADPCAPAGGIREKFARAHRRHHERRGHPRLQGMLFVWSGITILVTCLVAGLTSYVTSSGPMRWNKAMEGAAHMASRRFAEVWDDPTARVGLAAEIAAELDVGVQTFDASSAPLENLGTVQGRPVTSTPVHRDGRHVGRVEFYAPKFKPRAELILPLLGAFAVIWAFSGLLARKFARPLAELAATADAIGRGNLDRRSRVMRHAPGEVVLLADAIDDMAGRIQRQMVDQRELLAAVSHEVRSPLARIRLLVEMARSPAPASEDGEAASYRTPGKSDGAADAEGADPSVVAAEREKALSEIDREVEEIDALVGSLLASSRLDFGTTDSREVDPVAIARDALVRSGLPARLLTAEERLPTVMADPTLIARALANLVDNARVHGGGVTRLVAARENGSEIRFSVEDAGPGLGADVEQLFLAFHRRPGTHGALGLGLAIVARIAEAHGGRAFARNRAEGGAEIGFTIAAGPGPRSSAPVSAGV